MNIRKALALAALISLPTASPAFGAKEAKVPRCKGQSKRPANPYGTVLPNLPAHKAAGATAGAGPTQLFPSPAAPSTPAPSARGESTVPPISAVTPSPHHDGVRQPFYASC